MSIETEIQSEVDALKARFQETKSLYREVCALLFFRYGITPTTNKLYQFVRKGSMSAPADALTKFWDELRSKARIEVDHPDLPDEVKQSAAAAIAAVWRQASAAAREELRAMREEASAEVATTRAELQAAQELHNTLQDNIELVRGQLTSATAKSDEVRTELESERRSHAASAARIQELQRSVEDLRSQLQRQQDTFSADLAKAREAVEVANARADASDRRALLEIDQERQAKARVEKQLESMRGQYASLEMQSRDRAAASAAAATTLRASLQAAEMGQVAAERARESLLRELAENRTNLVQAREDVIRAQAEAMAVKAIVDRLAPASVETQAPEQARGSKTARKRS